MKTIPYQRLRQLLRCEVIKVNGGIVTDVNRQFCSGAKMH